MIIPWGFWPLWLQRADKAEVYYCIICKNESDISTGELLPAYRQFSQKSSFHKELKPVWFSVYPVPENTQNLLQ